MLTRILLLFSLSLIMRLTTPLFELFGHGVSGRDLILLVGGLFLIGKSTHEIHSKLEGEEGHASARVAPTFTSVIIQILLLDIVFSLDSVITAVGMVDRTCGSWSRRSSSPSASCSSSPAPSAPSSSATRPSRCWR